LPLPGKLGAQELEELRSPEYGRGSQQDNPPVPKPQGEGAERPLKRGQVNDG